VKEKQYRYGSIGKRINFGYQFVPSIKMKAAAHTAYGIDIHDYLVWR